MGEIDARIGYQSSRRRNQSNVFFKPIKMANVRLQASQRSFAKWKFELDPLRDVTDHAKYDDDVGDESDDNSADFSEYSRNDKANDSDSTDEEDCIDPDDNNTIFPEP